MTGLPVDDGPQDRRAALDILNVSYGVASGELVMAFVVAGTMPSPDGCAGCLFALEWGAGSSARALVVETSSLEYPPAPPVGVASATGSYAYFARVVPGGGASVHPYVRLEAAELEMDRSSPATYTVRLPASSIEDAALHDLRALTWTNVQHAGEDWRATDRGPDCTEEKYLPGEGVPCTLFGPPLVLAPAAEGAPPTGALLSWAAAAARPAGLATLGLALLVPLAALLIRSRARPAGPRYQHVRDLAAGAFGRTWLARDTRLKRDVVIKELHAAARADEATRASILREAQVVAKISHPNVVTIYDVELDGPAPRIVMEHLPGGSLADRLARGPLPLAQTARLADELLAALERVHVEGVVHRDIKPANVLFTADGSAKLVDFGIARAPHNAETVAATAALTGTPLYMAPEQVLGERTDARSDLYALAALLHEAATGVPVVGRPSSLAALQRAIIEEPPRISPDLPAPFARVLAKALAKAREERYQSAAEMRAAFDIDQRSSASP